MNMKKKIKQNKIIIKTPPEKNKTRKFNIRISDFSSFKLRKKLN